MEEFELLPSTNYTFSISYDTNKKEIGDCIEIIDFVSLFYNTGKSLDMYEIEELSKINKFMVVESGLNNNYKLHNLEFKLDIVVVNLHNKKYYKCSSGHVKIIPFN